MRMRMALLALLGVAALAGWVYSSVELQYAPARVATTFVDFDSEVSTRDALKAGLERYPGGLDIAVEEFDDVPLQFVLIRLSSDRRIRLLLGRGGESEAAEAELCRQLNELFEVRFLDELHHRFVVLGGMGVMTSSVDWTTAALAGGLQTVTEVESVELAAAYLAQFNALWGKASSACVDRLRFP